MNGLSSLNTKLPIAKQDYVLAFLYAQTSPVRMDTFTQVFKVKSVYDVCNAVEREGKIQIDRSGIQLYQINDTGRSYIKRILASPDPDPILVALTQDYTPRLPIVGKFYSNQEISEIMEVSTMGGIRISKGNHLVLCSAPYNPQKQTIYQDHFAGDDFHYTGQGQEGDQEITAGNKAIIDSKQAGMPIHLFKKHNEGGLWEYLGEVSYQDHYWDEQTDSKGNRRKVVMFKLKLHNYSQIETTKDALEREADSSQAPLTGQELDDAIQKINSTIKLSKPRKRITRRTKQEYQRSIEIVRLLKQKYQKCQTCGKPHFPTLNGQPSSEVHHIVPWAKSQDDSIENLVVLCPLCHKKLEKATLQIRRHLFDQLLTSYPEISYKKPNWFEKQN